MADATLDRLDQKLDDVKERLVEYQAMLTKHMDQDRADFNTLHVRVNSLRRWQAWIIGICSGITALLGFINLLHL